LQVIAAVLKKEEVASKVYKIRFFAPQIADVAQPGQFVHIKCGEEQNFILRRPFSIHQTLAKDSIEILFKVVGRGTAWLAKLQPKESADIIGPLGNGFNMSGRPGKIMLVAGGMGIAPLIFLAEKLAKEHTKTYTVIGATNKEFLIDYMNLKRLTRKITVATEDGSQGTKGLITDILPAAIAEDSPDTIFACGPWAMLKKVAFIAEREGVACQVALEGLMACGVGACLSCAVKTKTGFKRVCADGPVFDSREIAWERD